MNLSHCSYTIIQLLLLPAIFFNNSGRAVKNETYTFSIFKPFPNGRITIAPRSSPNQNNFIYTRCNEQVDWTSAANLSRRCGIYNEYHTHPDSNDETTTNRSNTLKSEIILLNERNDTEISDEVTATYLNKGNTLAVQWLELNADPTKESTIRYKLYARDDYSSYTYKSSSKSAGAKLTFPNETQLRNHLYRFGAAVAEFDKTNKFVIFFQNHTLCGDKICRMIVGKKNVTTKPWSLEVMKDDRAVLDYPRFFEGEYRTEKYLTVERIREEGRMRLSVILSKNDEATPISKDFYNLKDAYVTTKYNRITVCLHYLSNLTILNCSLLDSRLRPRYNYNVNLEDVAADNIRYIAMENSKDKNKFSLAIATCTDDSCTDTMAQIHLLTYDIVERKVLGGVTYDDVQCRTSPSAKKNFQMEFLEPSEDLYLYESFCIARKCYSEESFDFVTRCIKNTDYDDDDDDDE